MDPVNLLVVERGADWTHWSATLHLVSHAMLVLAQQDDESSSAFRGRIRARLGRLNGPGLNAVVLLRAPQGSELNLDALLHELSSHKPRDVRAYPAAVEQQQHAYTWPDATIEGSDGLQELVPSAAA
jgi:hypothetical protein